MVQAKYVKFDLYLSVQKYLNHFLILEPVLNKKYQTPSQKPLGVQFHLVISEHIQLIILGYFYIKYLNPSYSYLNNFVTITLFTVNTNTNLSPIIFSNKYLSNRNHDCSTSLLLWNKYSGLKVFRVLALYDNYKWYIQWKRIETAFV